MPHAEANQGEELWEPFDLKIILVAHLMTKEQAHASWNYITDHSFYFAYRITANLGLQRRVLARPAFSVSFLSSCLCLCSSVDCKSLRTGTPKDTYHFTP